MLARQKTFENDGMEVGGSTTLWARMWWLSKNTGIHCYICWLELPFDHLAQAEVQITVLLETRLELHKSSTVVTYSRQVVVPHNIEMGNPFASWPGAMPAKVDELHEKQGHTETLPDDDDELRSIG